MTLKTQPCMTCGLHHRNRDFPPACMGAMRTRIGGLESTVKVYERVLGIIADPGTAAMTDHGTVLALRSHARLALNPEM